MRLVRALLVVLLGIEGFLLLRPEGVLVVAAQHGHRKDTDQAAHWWRQSPVHMGCSVRSCTRPATRTATYRQMGPRGAIWRAYGFCDVHEPPETLTGLVYRLGQPSQPGYDVPLTPFWTEVYFLLGILAFGIWCVCVWRYATPRTSPAAWSGMLVLQIAVVAGFWMY